MPRPSFTEYYYLDIPKVSYLELQLPKDNIFHSLQLLSGVVSNGAETAKLSVRLPAFCDLTMTSTGA